MGKSFKAFISTKTLAQCLTINQAKGERLYKIIDRVNQLLTSERFLDWFITNLVLIYPENVWNIYNLDFFYENQIFSTVNPIKHFP